MSIRLGDKLIAGNLTPDIKLYDTVGENTDGAINQLATTELLDSKQNKLVAGEGIVIDETNPDSPIIYSTGGGSSGPSGGGFLFQQIAFPTPIEHVNLVPLNDPGQTTGVLLENVNVKYPTLWQKLLDYKERGLAAKEAGDPNSPEWAYAIFTYTQEEYDNTLEFTKLTDSAGNTLKLGYCASFVIDEENKTVRFPFKGDSFDRGFQSGYAFVDTDKIRNITGKAALWGAGIRYGSGALGNNYNPQAAQVSQGSGQSNSLSFDASKDVPTGDENQPRYQAKFYYLIIGNAIEEVSETKIKQDIEDYATDTVIPQIAAAGQEWLSNIEYKLGNLYQSVRTTTPKGLLRVNGENSEDTTEYTETNFPDLYNALKAGSILSVSLEKFDELIQANGWCGVFGFTEGENFKTPKITNQAQWGIIPADDGSNRNLGRVLIRSKGGTQEDPIYFNLYNDGWVEQGTVTPVGDGTVNLSISMLSANYNVLISNLTTSASATLRSSTLTTTSFKMHTSVPSVWQVIGYAAEVPTYQPNYYVVAYSSSTEVTIADYQNILNDYTNDTLKPELTDYANEIKRTWPILTQRYFNYILNDLSWLRSNTFSWQSGEMYKAAYNHLVNDFDITNPKTDYLKSNITAVGSLLDNTGVLSGFTTSIYGIINNVTPAILSGNTWEVVFKFKLNTLGVFNPIIGGASGTYVMDLYVSANNKLAAQLSSNGSSWNICSVKEGTTILAANIDYYAKLEYNGTAYVLSLSTTGTDEDFANNIQWTLDSTTAIEATTDKIFVGFRDGNYNRGIIDLNSSYINVAGSRIWSGVTAVNYYLSKDLHKICLPDQETVLSKVYQEFGFSPYYILDTVNKQFKLPRNNTKKLVRSVRNEDGSWYNLYSNGWVEQGGLTTGAYEIKCRLPITMYDTNYYANAYTLYGTESAATSTVAAVHLTDFKTYEMSLQRRHNGGAAAGSMGAVRWEVKGYAADSVLTTIAPELEYYFVGNFSQSEAEQDLGELAEAMNESLAGKADADNVVDLTSNQSINGFKLFEGHVGRYLKRFDLNTTPSSSIGEFTFILKDIHDQNFGQMQAFQTVDNENRYELTVGNIIDESIKYGVLGVAANKDGRMYSYSSTTPSNAIGNEIVTANQAAYLVMPSNRKLNLTLGASGAQYTAPSDGYFCILKEAVAINEYLWFYNVTTGIEKTQQTSTGNGYVLRDYFPVKRNDVVAIAYSLSGTTHIFAFVYANGAS